MFEQGVIRPPSEANSLLVRVTRNCPWNRCLFCPAYKGTVFSRRSVAEIKEDIDEMARYHGRNGSQITTAFFQDADSMILPTEDLLEVLKLLGEAFPSLTRITSYARAKSLKRKSVQSLKTLKAAGLTRIHTGLESGSVKVLKLIQKGESPEEMVEGGRRVMAAGIQLSEYIMPGVGGKDLSRENALETADVLNRIRPDFIRVRTFALPPDSPMEAMAREGRFVPMNDLEIVSEIRELLLHLEEMPSHFRCADFSLNLLMHIDGYLDRDRDRMREDLDSFLSLPEPDQKAYVLLQRSGHYGVHPLEMLKHEDLMSQLHEKIKELENGKENDFNGYIRAMMAGQLPRPQTGSWV
ncbi:MAG: radical SAM protein [Deltaproteobacteria bacterium]|jgi:radical SAM superfamily enzyme|nr:radical SAM protein [Deltaproteobacteria bacterium]